MGAIPVQLYISRHSFDTSIVQGFLSQSKCFIATAAFRDLEFSPACSCFGLSGDQFLENFSLGREVSSIGITHGHRMPLNG